MASQITVFRSADESAGEDAAKVQQMLAEEGIPATVVDDDAPGVPEGAYEVRVEEANRARAEELIAKYSPDTEMENPDPSHDLDLVTVFESVGEIGEAEMVQAVLEDGGISAVLIGDARYPNFPREVRVAREHEAKAKELIAEAQAAGPGGAEEAESGQE